MSGKTSEQPEPSLSVRQLTDRGPRKVGDVNDLSDCKRELVTRMLIEGATFEDVVEAVNVEEQGEQVPVQAIQNFFRANSDLQAQRVRHQCETARSLKQALGDPQSAMSDLADSVLLLGLMRLNRRGSELDVWKAMKERQERQDHLLKEMTAEKGAAETERKLAWLDQRIEAEKARAEALKFKVEQLKQTAERSSKDDEARERMIEQIREIYGLVQQPIAEESHVAT